MSHDREHEAWLDALAAGELDPSSAAVHDRLRSCSMCAREWEEVRGMQSVLERNAARVRAASQAVPGMPPAAAEARAEAALRSAMNAPAAGASEARAPAARGRQFWFALAAGLLLCLGWYLLRTPKPQPDPRWLGPANVELAAPAWPREGLSLSWREKTPSGLVAWVAIEARASAAESWQLQLELPGGPSNAVQVPAESVAGWPRELRWRVELRSIEGNPQGQSRWSEVFTRP